LGILAGNLDGGVLLLLFPPYFLGAMVLDLVVFVVVVFFFLVEDLVDGVVVGLGLFPNSFFLMAFLVSFWY
jgi:hypothetical protein